MGGARNKIEEDKGTKRKLEDQDQGMVMEVRELNQVRNLVMEWVNEVKQEIVPEECEWDDQIFWDDVHGGILPKDKVIASRNEEVSFMKKRELLTVRPIKECWEKTGKAPTSVRWVGTNKGTVEKMDIRQRLVARDFKGNDRNRDELFAGTPPLEAKRMLISKAATKRNNRIVRKLLFIDVRKAHLNPRCEEDVYVELPEEWGAPPGMCGKLNFWLYGFRKAAAAWEKLYSSKLEGIGFVRGMSSGVVFYHPVKDISLAVHGDDFTFCGEKQDLIWIATKMEEWFEIKNRGILGNGKDEVKEIVLLGRILRWNDWGIEYEADPKHRNLVLEHFGLSKSKSGIKFNGDKEDKEDEEYEKELLGNEESTSFRGIAARLNFLSLDSPELQFPVKQGSREMANPCKGSWKKLKKIARFLINRERTVWEFRWQEECERSWVVSDSDWGGNRKDRKSTSGGVWMVGNHCIKTWSSSQGAIALSSAEAEFYAMVEAVTKAKGLLSLAQDLGLGIKSNVIELGTDSEAAKSFVNRRGLGKMRHIEVRDLWLQKEIADGKDEVVKVPGEDNPADLMTKILDLETIHKRLNKMGIRAEWN